VVAREKLPDWERLWDDFTQRELRLDVTQASQPNCKEEENVALHAKKSSGAGGSNEMRKVRCFACHKSGHYANKCRNKKSEVATTSSIEMDAFAEKFDDEFSLVATLSSSDRLVELEDNRSWFVDSGSSHHMMRMSLMFLSVSETGANLHVQSGVPTMHVVKGVGCVRFQLESGVSLEVDGVMSVLELRVNLLSVSALAGIGYKMMFVVLEYERCVLVLPLTIPLSPKHRLKPPFDYLNLD
jgi:hypothetical protein